MSSEFKRFEFIKISVEICWVSLSRIDAARWHDAATGAVPNYEKPHPLVITLRLPLYPERTLGGPH